MKKLLKWLKGVSVLTAFCGLLSVGCLLHDQTKHKAESVVAMVEYDYSSNEANVNRVIDSSSVRITGTFSVSLVRYLNGADIYYKYHFVYDYYETITYNSNSYKLKILNEDNTYSNLRLDFYSDAIYDELPVGDVNARSYLNTNVGQLTAIGLNAYRVKLSSTFGTFVDSIEYTLTNSDVLCVVLDSNDSRIGDITILNGVVNNCLYLNSSELPVNRVYDFSLLVNNDGYQAGIEQGYISGYTDGYQSGNNEGYENGYNGGYQDGVDSQQSAISNAYSNGYAVGFNEGSQVDSTATTIFSGILQVALVPINFFLAIFNFEILGINLSAFIRALFTVAITVIIIRTIFGGKGASDS